MDSLFWGRMDYQDMKMRYDKQQGTDGFEWLWQGSASAGASNQIFAGDIYGTGQGGYSTWINFDGTDDQVIDDPARHDYNVDQWVDKVVQDAREQADHTLTSQQMWACGTDFQYQNADHWCVAVAAANGHALLSPPPPRPQRPLARARARAQRYTNLDKLIHYVNLNGTVNAMYSTPSLYVDQKHKAGLVWEVRAGGVCVCMCVCVCVCFWGVASAIG